MNEVGIFMFVILMKKRVEITGIVSKEFFVTGMVFNRDELIKENPRYELQ
jgi:hypothetical protein